MEIRRLKGAKKPIAMELVWRVFQRFEAPEQITDGIWYTLMLYDRTEKGG